MDTQTLLFQNNLQDFFQDKFPLILESGIYLPDCEVRPVHAEEEGLVSLYNLGYVYQDMDDTLLYRNDSLTKSRLRFTFQFSDTPDETDDWSDFIQSFSIVLDLDDVSHPDYIQWEQHMLNGEISGELKVNDEEILEHTISAQRGLKRGMLHTLNVILPQHADRYPTRDVPPDRIQKVYQEEQFLESISGQEV